MTEKTALAFEGFIQPKKNYFHMPNVWIDICAGITNLAELKVVQYVLRHTWGFHEYGIPKAISVDEFMYGRRLANGSRMDKRTGLSNHSVIDGLKAAIKHGYLVCEVDTSDLARVKKSYALRMIAPGEDSSPPETSAPGEESTASSEESSPSYEESAYPGEDSSYRSEKDTSRNTLKKDTEERQDTLPRNSAPPSSGAAIALPTRAQSSQDEPYQPDFTANQDRTGELHDTQSHGVEDRRAASHSGRRVDDRSDIQRDHNGSETSSASAGDAQDQGHAGRTQSSAPVETPELSTLSVSSPQRSAKVENKPKRTRTKAAVVVPEFTVNGHKVYDAWCSLFKSPPRVGPKTVECADALYPLLVPWCKELKLSCKDLLNEIKGQMYATDTSGFYKRGITLCDIERDFEKWQSAKTQELEQTQSSKSLVATLPDGPVNFTQKRLAAQRAAKQEVLHG